MLKSCLTVMLLGLLGACATSGETLSDSQLAQIKVGETKYADLVKIAGEPTAELQALQAIPKGCAGHRVRAVTYASAHNNIVTGGTKTENHTFYVNEAGVLCSAGLTQTQKPMW